MAKREPSKRKKFPIWSVVLTVLWLFVRILVSTLLADWLIVLLGIRTYHKICFVLTGVLLVSAIVTLLRLVPFVRNLLAHKIAHELKRAEEAQKTQFVRDYAQDSANPELTRQMLDQILEETNDANISSLMSSCLAQMNRMDTLQRKQNVLIQTNDAVYLKQTVEVLNGVERRICRNLRSIINMWITVDRYEQLDQADVKALLDDNESKLSDAMQLLDVSRKWVNSYNENTDGDEVQLWIKTIEDSLKEG